MPDVLAVGRAVVMNDILTPRQRLLLERMRDGEEIYYDSGRGCIGGEEEPSKELLGVSARMFYSLLRLCAIQCDSSCKTYWHITGTGRKLLDGDTSGLQIVYGSSKSKS